MLSTTEVQWASSMVTAILFPVVLEQYGRIMCRCSANLIHLNRRRRSDIQLLISGIYELCDGERKSQIDNYSCLELEVGDFAKFWRSIIIYASKSIPFDEDSGNK